MGGGEKITRVPLSWSQEAQNARISAIRFPYILLLITIIISIDFS